MQQQWLQNVDHKTLQEYFTESHNPCNGNNTFTCAIDFYSWMEDSQSKWCCIFINPILEKSNAY